MCNLYSMNRRQDEIPGIVGAMRDGTGNMPPLPDIFPDYLAPIVRTDAEGDREMVEARWGMQGPPQFGGAPITNVRDTRSAHWRSWLAAKRSSCRVLVLRIRGHEASQDPDLVLSIAASAIKSRSASRERGSIAK